MANNASATSSATDEQPPRPYWIPPGVEYESLPAELQAVITGVINPAYQELVLAAPTSLEQSTGLTIVHLLWLEVLDQVELGRELGGAHSDESSQRRATQIGQLLRVIGAKDKTSRFLLRIQELRQRWGDYPAPPDPMRTNLPVPDVEVDPEIEEMLRNGPHTK